MLSEGFDKYVHRWKLAVVQNGPKRTENRNENTIRDGGSTAALYAANTGKIFKNYIVNITLPRGEIWNLAQTLGFAS